MTGKTFHQLSVISFSHVEKTAYWLCKCTCGNTTVVKGAHLRDGSTKSCGCLVKIAAKELMTTHGYTGTPTYNSYVSMKKRCTYRGSKDYPLYGGRGVRVCDRWLHDFNNFLTDMGERPDGTTLDRIDPDGDYDPCNCRWATYKEQSLNKRNTAKCTVEGVTKTLQEWELISGIRWETIKERLKRGWKPYDAVFTKNSPNQQLLTLKNRTQTVGQWAKETGFQRQLILYRIKKGWSVERALTEKPRKKVKNNV